ncbi:hypothetical protein JCM33374_g1985 [Metschnikowia sp. JCM 33374]|nr:hypothetical protein JCM33374_g1985 [Metschnikowia sp. JCM 33374]
MSSINCRYQFLVRATWLKCSVSTGGKVSRHTPDTRVAYIGVEKVGIIPPVIHVQGMFGCLVPQEWWSYCSSKVHGTSDSPVVYVEESTTRDNP